MKIHATIGFVAVSLIGCATSGEDGTRAEDPVLHMSIHRVPLEDGAYPPVQFMVTLIPGEEESDRILGARVVVRDGEWVGMARVENSEILPQSRAHLPTSCLPTYYRNTYTSMRIMSQLRPDGRIHFALRFSEYRDGIGSSFHLVTTVKDGETMSLNRRGKREPPPTDTKSWNEAHHVQSALEQVRELVLVRKPGLDGQVAIRQKYPKEFLALTETRVFTLKTLQPPGPPESPPGYKIWTPPHKYNWLIAAPTVTPTADSWELIGVVEALLTRTGNGGTLGKMDFDTQTNSFIIWDTSPVLDRIVYVLKVIEKGPDSQKPGMPPGPDKGLTTGRLKVGRVSELLLATHEALSKLKPGYVQRGVLRKPLLELKDEISRIDWDSPVPQDQ